MIAAFVHFNRRAVVGAVMLCFVFLGYCNALDYPASVKPGVARCSIANDLIILENDVLSLELSQKAGKLRLVEFSDKVSGGRTLDGGELFEIRVDGRSIKCSEMRLGGGCVQKAVAGDSGSRNLAERFGGIEVQAILSSADGKLEVEWKMILRDQSNYARQVFEVHSGKKAVKIDSVTFNEVIVEDGHTKGVVSGSPVVSGTMFFGYEHPNSKNIVYDSAGGINYALNRSAKASGVFQNLRPGLAVDGDYNVWRHWGCQNTPVWLSVDMEEVRRIDSVRLVTYHNNKRYYGYTMEVSDSGADWETFIDASGNKAIANAGGYVHKTEGVNGRYVKVTITNNSEGGFYGGHIVELEVLGEREETKTTRGKRVTCRLQRNTELAKGQTLRQSAVMGVVPRGQLRRGFLYYIERERVRPYHQFLHYNSWYDIAYPSRDKMNAVECVGVINGFGKELTRDRGVRLDSFVFDDGWDDPRTLWRILEKNFPDGWRPLKAAADSYGSRLGVWMSPWGGYGQTKQDRLDYGKTQGFETGKAGFSLAGEKYFKRFRQSCMDFVEDYDVNFFKFDGTDASLLNETEGLFRLTDELYKTGKVEFISMTVGTWASPFWLRHGDSIWRGGADMSFAGKGTRRQQWLTYRDADTYARMVVQGPLYPLSSFMNQGIAHAKWGTAKLQADAEIFSQEVHSFFGIGTNLQELYISYDLMTDAMWDSLAEGARWSRANEHVLVDTHWVGGDPGKSEVYGCASWQRNEGIIMLRNPDDKPQEFTVDVADAFQLPANSAKSYPMKSPWKADAAKPPINLTAGKEHTFRLKPFEVIVLQGKGK